ncbi:MAG: 3-deoxy-manno-octulosonate cytidylyltransferase [Candidatus Rokubacteria bacterium]|nr:3-deoxy-manno-octulosonate cytidylyltransferase [Candidatus Rokubacteria bacterium]
MSGLRVLGVIPARLQSTRLPRKVLREIAGVPMVAHVFRRARQSPLLSDLLVATDAQDVVDACHALGIPAVMTSADHPSGTDRVWEVSRSRAADVYVNIQGDEPLITPGHIAALVEPFQRRPDTQVTTLRIRATFEEAGDPNVVKVVCTLGETALYFSRFPIPFDRVRAAAPEYWKHLGIYAYRREALESFHRFPPSALETAERLEQLRFLEHGIPIRVVETTEPTIGVDTASDLRAVEAYLKPRPQ